VQTVAETAHFIRRAAKLLTEAERADLIAMIAADPRCGDLLEGTGGLRKVRVARGGRGKSGGARVVYYFFSPNAPVYLMEIFGKGEKANLSAAERNELAKVAKVIASYWR
jgi:hypothetical protein